MSADGFEARVVSGDRGSTIYLTGTVNRMAKDALESAYVEAARNPGEIDLDFSEVDYINSTGIAVIVGVLAMARSEARDMGAHGLSDHYREVFEITRLSDFIRIHESSNQ